MPCVVCFAVLQINFIFHSFRCVLLGDFLSHLGHSNRNAVRKSGGKVHSLTRGAFRENEKNPLYNISFNKNHRCVVSLWMVAFLKRRSVSNNAYNLCIY